MFRFILRFITGFTPADERLDGIKSLTVKNFLKQDPTSNLFVKIGQDNKSSPMSAKEWAAYILGNKLSDNVPLEIRKLSEAALGIYCYGYYFYPFFTLAAEQMARVCEAAAMERCKQIGKNPKGFNGAIASLKKENIISDEEKGKWQSIKSVRNDSSHLENLTILPPSMAHGFITIARESIENLFKSK